MEHTFRTPCDPVHRWLPGFSTTRAFHCFFALHSADLAFRRPGGSHPGWRDGPPLGADSSPVPAGIAWLSQCAAFYTGICGPVPVYRRNGAAAVRDNSQPGPGLYPGPSKCFCDCGLSVGAGGDFPAWTKNPARARSIQASTAGINPDLVIAENRCSLPDPTVCSLPHRVDIFDHQDVNRALQAGFLDL